MDFKWDEVKDDKAKLGVFHSEERVFLKWKASNSSTLLHIVAGLLDSLSGQAMWLVVVKDLWQWLIDEFEAKGDAYAQEVHRQFEQKQCMANRDVSAHLDEMDELRRKYNAAAQEHMLETEFYCAVLALLLDYYRTMVAMTRTQTTALKLTSPKFEDLIRAVCVKYDLKVLEASSKSKKGTTDNVVLTAELKKMPEAGSKKPRRGKFDVSKAKCYDCNEFGHFAREKNTSQETPPTKEGKDATKAHTACMTVVFAPQA
ncbi:hypothetical protein AURDEDRAFT_165762 [Auricularia subglabra TFB-10046 SS5]|nr:hypothetical protein AURDEDRAFT_165762 [Auricularia subglabra TFB-10046 SS5]